MGERGYGAGRCLLSLQELALFPLDTVLSSRLCLYMLEHNLDVALNVWGVTWGVVEVYPLQSCVITV